MSTVQFNCTGCGKKLFNYDPATHYRRYKSPVKECPKCGRKYADPRCHEIVLEGLPKDIFSVKAHFFLIILGAFALYIGIVMFGKNQPGALNGIQLLMPAVITVLGVLFFVGGIVEVISILTGIKQKKYDRLTMESKERLKNRDYAYTLYELGYLVPQEYL